MDVTEANEIVDQSIEDYDSIKAVLEENGVDTTGIPTSAYAALVKSIVGSGGGGGIVDQSYNPESPNAQSGIAVAEAIKHISYVESLDKNNALNLFEMESGTYILKGYFLPYPNSSTRLTFSKLQLVSISNGSLSTCVQVFYPSYNTIQYLNIYADEESDTGYSYERKDAKLYYMEDDRNKVKRGDVSVQELNNQLDNTTQYPSMSFIADVVDYFQNKIEWTENTENKVFRIDENSTDKQYPSAKAVNDLVNQKDSKIRYIESLDEANLKNLRDLETGAYYLYGYFKPFEGSNDVMTAENFATVYHVSAGTHILSLGPKNSNVTFFEILVDDTVEDGFTYSRTNINLLELQNAIGDIDTALDNIIAIQNALLGGDST